MRRNERTTKMLPSKSFNLSIVQTAAGVRGLIAGKSSGGYFSYKASGKTFDEVIEKFEGMLPYDDLREFYDDAGAGADGSGSELRTSGAGSQPTSCS